MRIVILAHLFKYVIRERHLRNFSIIQLWNQNTWNCSPYSNSSILQLQIFYQATNYLQITMLALTIRQIFRNQHQLSRLHCHIFVYVASSQIQETGLWDRYSETHPPHRRTSVCWANIDFSARFVIRNTPTHRYLGYSAQE